MKKLDVYKDKYFSVLGDSISTLIGYSQPEDAAFYDVSRKYESGVFAPGDTWWGQVISSLGGRLLVNNSISGSMVIKHPHCETESYGCSDERTSSLALDEKLPNVIMIFLGTNDWGNGARILPREDANTRDLSVFSAAYRTMLEKLKGNYPEAELWCFTLPVSTCKRREDFSFPYRYGGEHIEAYCSVIRTCAYEYRCRIIDLYNSDTPYDTIDGFHPNADGMRTLADAVLGELQ